MATRTPTPANRRKRKANTWKDIDQSVKPKAMSSASERRVWMGRVKATLSVVAVVLALGGALYFLPKLEAGPELLTKAGESLPISNIDVVTNGSLDRAYILKVLNVAEDANLLSVDLDDMKERLESIGQVKAAVVSRRFPDALEVTVVEREPMARILAQRSNGERLMLFVDDSGEVFEGDRLDPKIARSLPFLDGVALSKKEEGFSRIENIGPVANLLSEARAIAPHLYSGWRIVSLERENRLIAKGKNAKEVVFDQNADFRNQLGKLDYILDYYRSSQVGGIESVDLTLGDQVPVRSL